MPSEAPSESVTEAFGAGTEEETVMLPEYSGGHSLALPEREGERADFTVVIDAGHGQRDPGNMALDAKESDINLALSLRVCKLLSDMGYNVLLTRADDTAMLGADPQYDTDKEAEARRLWAVREGADLYISIHCNAADDANAKGTRLFYNNRPITSFAGRALALCYQNSLNDEFSAEIASGAVPAVKNNYLNGMQEDIYIVLQDVTMPAVLIEIGFMTNEKSLPCCKVTITFGNMHMRLPSEPTKHARPCWQKNKNEGKSLKIRRKPDALHFDAVRKAIP
ncbi:MAG: N-acetylmuramoyl-L-alanine amidase [Clostridia bacterium]|nr:N-acetylmuramoyl-L-alanine amidase [Clostridia bacterium]